MIRKLSRTGLHHSSIGCENQDAIFHGQNNRFCVVTLADGVSTCKDAKIGAQIAGESITDLFLKKGEHFFNFEEKKIAEFAVSHVNYKLNQLAIGNSENIEEYSSTIASVVVDKRNGKMLCLSLGDSIIMATGGGKCHVLTAPADTSYGCCVTTTKDAANMTFVKVLDTTQYESVLICSDGAWKHMFDKNKLKRDVSEMLANNQYNDFANFLNKQKCFDDYSFISLDVRKKVGRKTA